MGGPATNFVFAHLKSVCGYAEDLLKLYLSACHNKMKSTVKKLAVLFSAALQDCADDLCVLSSVVEQLFVIVMTFSRSLDQMKVERRLADFDDLEYWVLRLLVRETESGYE